MSIRNLIRNFGSEKKPVIPTGPSPMRFVGNSNRVEEWSPQEILQKPEIQGVIKSMRRAWQTDPAEFDRHILPIISLATEWFGPLPASEKHHHSGPAGMVRHLMETAFFCIQRQGNYAPEKDMRGQARIANEISHNQSLVLTGILHDVGKLMTDMEIRLGDDTSKIWNPYCESLDEFCSANGSRHIEWKWMGGRHQKHEDPRYALWSAGLWVGRMGLSLTLPMARKLVAALAQDEHSAIWDAALKADRVSTAESQKVSEHFAQEPDPLKVIRQAIQGLFDSRQWTYNKKGSPVWFTEFGAILVDDQAFRHIFEHLEAAGTSDEEFRFEHAGRVKNKMLTTGVLLQYETETKSLAYKIKFKPASFAKNTSGLYGVIVDKPELIGLIGLDRVDPAPLASAETESGRALDVVLRSRLAKDEPPRTGGGGPDGGGHAENEPAANQEGAADDAPETPVDIKEATSPTEESVEKGGGDDGLAAAFFEWVLRSLAEEMLVLSSDEKGFQKDPGFLDCEDEGVFMNMKPLMMFSSLVKKADGIPVQAIKESLTSIGLLEDDDKRGLMRLVDAFGQEVRKRAGEDSD